MAIDFTTYAGWLAGLKAWIDSDDLSDDVFAVCLLLAQTRLNRELDSQYMEAVAVIPVITSGLPIPLMTAVPDYNRVRLVTSSQNLLPLESLAFNEYQMHVSGKYGDGSPIGDNSDKPGEYAIEGLSLYVVPYASGGSTLTIHYYKKVPPIGPTLNTNVFTESHFDALLFASCLEVSRYIVEDERIPVWEAAYQNAVQSIGTVAAQSKLGSTPLRRQVPNMGYSDSKYHQV